MSGISIDHITAPDPAYTIYTGRNRHLQRFETEGIALTRDLLRVEVLRRAAVQPGCVRPWRLTRLAERIERATLRRCRTLASCTYYRDLRQRVCGRLWELADHTQNLSPRTCTMFPRGWEVRAGELHLFDPVARIAAIRSMINRCGVLDADGYIVAFIHGEFEPRRQVYQLHLHLLAAGGILRILDQVVRHTPTVESIRAEYGVLEWVFQRFRLDPELTNLPAPLTYLLKSYWPQKWQGYNAAGKLIRQRRGSRIDEPHHSEVLLWLDSHRLADLTLLMNIAVGCDGFRLSDRAYTNGTI